MKSALFGLILTSLVLGGCRKEPVEPEPKPPVTEEPQTIAKPAVKLTFSLLPIESPPKEMQDSAASFALLVTEKSGYAVETTFPKSYGEAIASLKAKKADVVVLSGWAYLKAHHAADADLFLAGELDGATHSDAQWFVAADSKIQKLADLKKKRIAFTAPTSAAGFLLPYAKLIEEGVVKSGADLQKEFAEVYFTGGDGDGLKVLLDGKVDAAAAPASALSQYLSEEDRAKVRSIVSIPGVPTHVLAVRADMDQDVRAKLKEALLALNSDQGPLLSGVFGAPKLIERSHGDHVTTLQNAQELVGTEYLVAEDKEPEEQPAGLEDAPKQAD